ncbi:MAG: sigma-54 dependent transcriptional regulator [Nitrospirae bacterium]|nr:sigma-54 dependent transcriptional regulator [Nitrospirota bacterium]
MARILVIDDQDGMRRSLGILLRREGYSVEEAANGEEAIAHLGSGHFDLVITDLKMSPGTGLDVLYYILERHPLTDVIIMTGYGTVDSAVLAMKLGAFDYITKPFKNEEILHRVRKSLAHTEAVREIGASRKGPEPWNGEVPIFGESKAIKTMVAMMRKIAKVDLTVLITGETGTGKTLVAKTIHGLSMRAKHPFVSVNCAAVPEYLLESELFGHTKGAFTGALLDRKGLFEEADGGTLFLDEIGAMPHPMQAKLLDVLQDHTIRRVGSNKHKEVDVRIITATNRDLEQAVQNGKFRQDLYYRIKVTRIHIPPLRERLEDISILARHFLDNFKSEVHRPDLTLSADALDFLLHYDYPGNVRELLNIITSAGAIASGSLIEVPDLSLSFTNRLFDVPGEAREGVEPGTLEEWEKDIILKSIRKNDHNLGKVCSELRISRTTLWRKMNKYGIG